MSARNLIIRFVDAAVQPEHLPKDGNCIVRRIVGAVEMKQLLPLYHETALGPDPRSARRNRVINDILVSLSENSELFVNKSKGVLLGTGNYKTLERCRYKLVFDDPDVEGILDGGHNMLAIGLYMLKDVMKGEEWKQVKSWDDLLNVWPNYVQELESRKDQFSTLIPVELLVPARDDEQTVAEFRMALIDICAARNNNAQLPLEAAANKKGFYEEIKKQIPDDLAARVEWKPNTWEAEDETRPVKVRDLVALAWIPLNLLDENAALPLYKQAGRTDVHYRVTPQNIYRNKGECSKIFDDLMRDTDVTEKGDASRHELIHDGVKSAFKVLGDLPELYDLIYEEFPEAYNSHNRRFRANPIVKLYDPDGRKDARAAGKDLTGFTATQPITPFMRRPVKGKGSSKPCSYPEGLIVPLVYGLQGLMVVENGKIRWAKDNPIAFVRKILPEIAGPYGLVLELGKWDPQKIAKAPESHEFAVQQFRSYLRNNK